MTDDELEQLRKQSERGSRLEESSDDGESLVADLVTVLNEIDDSESDRTKTIALRDKPVAALLATLDENPAQMTQVGQAFQRALDREPDEDFDRSEISRLAFRVALQEATPAVLEELKEAVAQQTRDQL